MDAQCGTTQCGTTQCPTPWVLLLFSILLSSLVTSTVTSLAWCVWAPSPCTTPSRCTTSKGTQSESQGVTTASQAPVTYTFKLAQPRVQPLPEHSHG